MRDPTQVFMLLEAIYSAFDVIARRRGVFKVETIGDSYVAVTGLPDPQRDHALIMARFARDCRIRFKEITRTLELALGPDTGDLCMRFGMHSGPVRSESAQASMADHTLSVYRSLLGFYVEKRADSRFLVTRSTRRHEWRARGNEIGSKCHRQQPTSWSTPERVIGSEQEIRWFTQKAKERCRHSG